MNTRGLNMMQYVNNQYKEINNLWTGANNNKNIFAILPFFTFWLCSTAPQRPGVCSVVCRCLRDSVLLLHKSTVVCCLHVDSSFTACKCHNCLPQSCVSSWSFAAVSPLSVQTARWLTFLRWTGHILPWSPVCSIAGRCDICFHSVWNRSATGLWPCYRLHKEKLG